MVRVEVVETSSQVWKTCILTAVLHSQMDFPGVGYRTCSAALRLQVEVPTTTNLPGVPHRVEMERDCHGVLQS